MFTLTGIAQSLSPSNPSLYSSVLSFGQQVLQIYTQNKSFEWIAIHNNAASGTLSAESYLPGDLHLHSTFPQQIFWVAIKFLIVVPILFSDFFLSNSTSFLLCLSPSLLFITLFIQGGPYANDAIAVSIGTYSTPKEFLLMTDTPKCRKQYAVLSQAGFSTVLQVCVCVRACVFRPHYFSLFHLFAISPSSLSPPILLPFFLTIPRSISLSFLSSRKAPAGVGSTLEDDGSLSYYCATILQDYINIESTAPLPEEEKGEQIINQMYLMLNVVRSLGD